MIKSDYLYGIDISLLANMPYKDVLIMKIHYSKRLMHKLVHTDNKENMILFMANGFMQFLKMKLKTQKNM